MRPGPGRIWSHDPAAAARFGDREWAELYAAAPANRPLRPDGKPNRPITMFNLMIVPVASGQEPSILRLRRLRLSADRLGELSAVDH